MDENRSILGIKRKYGNFFLGFLLLIFIIYSFLSPQIFFSNWPYLIMILFLLLALNIKDKTFLTILVILFLSSMFILQGLFYFIIPLTHNYQPTPSLPLMKMFNIDGKFQVSYYPDMPEAGDNVLLYLDVCDLASKSCVKCTICNLSGYFIDENGNKKILFENHLTNESEFVSFIYPGEKVEINLDFEGIDKRYDSFYLPKLNLIESIYVFFKESFTFGIITIISSIFFIGSSLFLVWKIFINIKNKKEIYHKRIKNIYMRFINAIKEEIPRVLFSLLIIPLLIILLISFIIGKPSLILGGLILILYGLGSLAPKLGLGTNKIYSVLLISLGILSILTKTLLKINIDYYALALLLIIIFNLIISYVLSEKKKITNNIFSLFIYIIIFYAIISLAGGIFKFLPALNEGISFEAFSLLLLSFIFMLIASFMFVDRFMLTIDSILSKIIGEEKIIRHNHYLYLVISSILVILVAGYFYLTEISSNISRDFLIILGLASVSSIASVAALKSIFDKGGILKR